MTQNELQTIKESIERTTRFQTGYPKLLITGNEKWDAYFRWGYELCKEREAVLSHAKRGVDNPTRQNGLGI